MLGSSRAKAGDARSLPGRIIGLAGVIALACLSALSTSASAQRDSRDQVPGLALVVPAGSHLSLQRKAFEYGLFWGAPVAAFPKSATGVTVVSKTGGGIDITPEAMSQSFDDDRILRALQRPGMTKRLEWTSAVSVAGGAVVSLASVWQSRDGESTMTMGEFVVIRHDAARKLDRGFGKEGLQRISSRANGLGILVPARVVALSSGRLAVLGYLLDEASSYARIFVIRLDADGVIDRKFGKNGMLVLGATPDIAPPFIPEDMPVVALDDDGLAVVTVSGDGVDTWPVTWMNFIDKTGAIVRRVGYDKIRVDRSGYGGIFVPSVLRRAPDGGFYLGGVTGASACGVVRLTKAHAVDASFGTQGVFRFLPAGSVNCRMSDVLVSGKTIYVSGYRERRDDKDGIFVDFFITHIDADRAEMNGAKLPMDFTAASRDLRIQTSHGVNLVPLSDGVIAAVYHCEFVTDQKRGGCSGGNVVKFSVRKSR